MDRVLLFIVFGGQYLCMAAATAAFARHHFYLFLLFALLAYAFPFGVGRLIKTSKEFDAAGQASPPRWADRSFKYSARIFIIVLALYISKIVGGDLWPTLAYSLFFATCVARDLFLIRFYLQNAPRNPKTA
jgi:Na+/H+-dicarboxylate symporter